MDLSPYRFVHAWLPLAAALQVIAGCAPPAPTLHSVAKLTVEPSTALPARLDIVSAHRHIWLIEADQQSIDVRIEVLDANGKVLQASDSPSRRGGPERAAVLLPRGNYTIRIVNADHPEKKARVSLRIERSHALANSVTNPWFLAELEETAAAAAFRSGAGTASLASYKKASARWRHLGQPVRAATARYRAAWISYRLQNDPKGAARDAQAAVRVFARHQASSLLAGSLLLRASARNDAEGGTGTDTSGWLARSRSDTARAASIYEQLHDSYGVAEALQVAAQTEYTNNNFAAARELLHQAETRYRELDERGGLTRTLANTAQIDYALGNYRSTIDIYDRIFTDGAMESAAPMRADMLDNSGYARMMIGDFEGSLRAHLQALQIHETGHDTAGIGRSLHGIGIAYLGLGAPQRALEYLQRATDVRKRANDTAQIVISLLALGNIRRDLGDIPVALAIHHQAGRYARTTDDRLRVMLALSRDYVAGQRYSQAESQLRTLLAAAQSADLSVIGTQAGLEAGRVQLALGNPATALPLLYATQREFDQGGALIHQAEALHLISSARRQTGELASAAQAADRALNLVERIRAFAANPELRARFLATRRAVYDTRVNMLLDEYSKAPVTSATALLAALRASDLMRARSLTDRIAAAATKESREELASAQRLAQELAAKGYHLEHLLDTRADPALIQATRDDVADLRSRYDAALKLLPSGNSAIPSPNAAAWRSLPSDTAILVYFVSAERCWLWTVTSDGVRGHALRPRNELVQAIRNLDSGLQPSSQQSDSEQVSRLLASVSALLLPVDDALRARPHWIVVPDGAIGSVPFSALRHGSAAPLIEDHDLLLATTYRAALQTAKAPLTLAPTPDRPPLLFADPVYAMSDTRLTHPAASRSIDIKRLPGTGREIAVIAARLHKSRPQVLLGFGATREAALSANARNASLLHFATHARADAQALRPAAVELSGFDRSGSHRNGLLTLSDLSVMQLRADLVVLSGCDSAMGEQIDGEGAMSLAYGFLAAGANAVVATQWQVSDTAMRRLMDRFYAAMIEGQPIPQALRTAQLNLMRTPPWQAPAAWAATNVMVSFRESNIQQEGADR